MCIMCVWVRISLHNRPLKMSTQISNLSLYFLIVLFGFITVCYCVHFIVTGGLILALSTVLYME